MPEHNHTKGLSLREYKTGWFILAFFGFLLIVLGSQDNLLLKGKLALGIVYGLGISFFTAFVIKIGITFIEEYSQRLWHKNHIEIIAERRKEAGKEYISENKKIKDSLKILSISATSAFLDLVNQGSLYDAIVKKQIELQILIVSPSSEAAKQRAREDCPGDLRKGMEGISEGFIKLNDIFKSLSGLLSAESEVGSVEVRITKDNPYLTIYLRDDDTIIYGLYISPGRGDETAAMKIRRKWNPIVFEQIKNHYLEKWSQVTKEQRLFIIKSRNKKLSYSFNEKLFKKISDELNLILGKKSKASRTLKKYK